MKKFFFLVSILIFFLFGCSKSTITRYELASDKHLLDINFRYIHMLSNENGWATSNDHLYITKDGGENWKDVTPPTDYGSNNLLLHTFILNTKSAWVIDPIKNTTNGTLYSTQNSGKTWTKKKVPFDSRPFFIKSNRHIYGWSFEMGALTGNQPVNIYVSKDGEPWYEIYHYKKASITKGELPYVGRKPGASFRPDGQVGWIPIELLDKNKYGFYRTDNMGKTWFEQELPIPAQYQNSYILMKEPPHFFDNRNASMLVEFEKSKDTKVYYDSVVYITNDGGSTWHSSMPIQSFKKVVSYSYADMHHFYILKKNGLYVTNDSGATWNRQSVPKNLIQIDFISPIKGWAIINKNELLLTKDGGKSWENIYK